MREEEMRCFGNLETWRTPLTARKKENLLKRRCWNRSHGEKGEESKVSFLEPQKQNFGRHHADGAENGMAKGSDRDKTEGKLPEVSHSSLSVGTSLRLWMGSQGRQWCGGDDSSHVAGRLIWSDCSASRIGHGFQSLSLVLFLSPSFFPHPPLYLSLSFSFSLPMSVCVSLFLLSLSLSLSHPLFLYPCVSLSLPVSLPLSISPSLSLSHTCSLPKTISYILLLVPENRSNPLKKN